LMISQSVLAALGIQLDVNRTWRGVHSLMSNTSMAMLALHFALHLKWVTTNVDRYILSPIRGWLPQGAQTPNVVGPNQ